MTGPVPSPRKWEIPPEARQTDDPLLSCLVILTHYFHRPHSAQNLMAGLPLENGRLTPDLVIRAARRAHMSGRVVKRPLDQILQLTLPAILLLNDGNACVAVSRDERGKWLIIQPDSGFGETYADHDTLSGQYSGHVIFLRPQFRFDQRAENASLPRPDHWFWGVVRHAAPLYKQVLIATLLINLFALAMPLFIMNVYDRVVPNSTFNTLWVLALGIMIVLIFDFAMKVLRSHFIDAAGKQIDVLLSASIFERFLGLKSSVRPKSVGAVTGQLQEFEAFREFITSATIGTLIDLPFLILFLLVIAWIGGWVVLAPLVIFPLIVVIGLTLHRPLAAQVDAALAASTQKQATLVETLVGIDTIKAVGAEGPFQRKWEQLVGEQSRIGLQVKHISMLILSQAGFFQQLALLSLVIIGIYQISNHALTVGGLIACTMLSNRALAPVSQIAMLIARHFQALRGLRAIDRLMQLPVERPDGFNPVHRPTLRGAIEFRNVTFAYGPDDVPALHNVSFRLQAGERVGIIGRIGSGKSTIARLILGLYAPQEGSIWIDGIDQAQIDPADLRRNIGYVPQEAFLFYGSVKSNIVLGAPHVDDALMLEAARLAGVTEFVSRNPKGFDMAVGEGGTSLSGGQRQSIVNARALLLSPPILLLDEPSNALDNRSEENLKARLKEYLGTDRSLILVTHRASMLPLVNRLIVMDNGRVIADGPKEKVLEALAGGQVHVAAN